VTGESIFTSTSKSTSSALCNNRGARNAPVHRSCDTPWGTDNCAWLPVATRDASPTGSNHDQCDPNDDVENSSDTNPLAGGGGVGGDVVDVVDVDVVDVDVVDVDVVDVVDVDVVDVDDVEVDVGVVVDVVVGVVVDVVVGGGVGGGSPVEVTRK